jgi:putative hydrolase of the HAD superfamily
MIDPGIKAVVFDAVNTLIHPEPSVGRVYASAAARHGAEIPIDVLRQRLKESYARQETIDAAGVWQTGEARERDRWRTVVAETMPETDWPRAFDELWTWFASTQAWRIADDVAHVLQTLHDRGLILGIASNFDARLAGIVAASPELALVRDRCVISSQIGWRKPSPRFFAHLVDLCGVEPSSILYVGDDRRNDYEGATAAGLRALWLTMEVATPEVATLSRLVDLI